MNTATLVDPPAIAAEPPMTLEEEQVLFDVLRACDVASGRWVDGSEIWSGPSGRAMWFHWLLLHKRTDSAAIFAEEGLEVTSYAHAARFP